MGKKIYCYYYYSGGAYIKLTKDEQSICMAEIAGFSISAAGVFKFYRESSLAGCTSLKFSRNQYGGLQS